MLYILVKLKTVSCLNTLSLHERLVRFHNFVTEESTPTMKDLNRYVVTTYATEWKNIGIELELELCVLDIISKSNQNDSAACFQHTLNKWLQLTPHATWRVLEVAITNVRRVHLGLEPVTDVYGKCTLTVIELKRILD